MLLIDAYNVLHLPDLTPGLDAGGVEELCRLLGVSRFAGRQAAVICDGTAPAGVSTQRGHGGDWYRSHGIEVVYVGHDRSADDEIERRLRSLRGRGVTVVSSDRRLRRAAGRAKARSVASDEFMRQLLRDEHRRGPRVPSFATDVPLDPYSVAGWMREFGMPVDDAVERLSRAQKESRKRPQPAKPTPPPASGSTPDAELHLSPEFNIERVLDDPLLRDAVREWGDRLRPEDLDMRQWLEMRGKNRPDQR